MCAIHPASSRHACMSGYLPGNGQRAACRKLAAIHPASSRHACMSGYLPGNGQGKEFSPIRSGFLQLQIFCVTLFIRTKEITGGT